MNPERPRSTLLSYETRVLLLALAAGVPGVLVAMFLLWTGTATRPLQWTLTVSIALVWVGLAFWVREYVVSPLQTIASTLAALHEGDYTMRARERLGDDALGLAMLEVNALAETLRQERLDAVEATALLSKVMEEIDVALFAFDEDHRLQLVNRSGERLLNAPRERLMGCTADELNLSHCLTGDAHRILDATFSGRFGRWELRRTQFREGGLPHQLVVLADLTRALRQEERQAWQRLVQVLRHEINNSLAPIHSLAGTMRRLLQRTPRPPDWEGDLHQGLDIIADRSGALGRFMAAYSQLTRLPDPRPAPVSVADSVQRAAALEPRLPVRVETSADLTLRVDRDQLDQLLINLIRNAVDAALETGGGVRIGWTAPDADGTHARIWVEDEGPGLTNTENLFVPFFTTKPQGSGIGLALSRQIAEAHGGTLTLANRPGGPGCLAEVLIPVDHDRAVEV